MTHYSVAETRSEEATKDSKEESGVILEEVGTPLIEKNGEAAQVAVQVFYEIIVHLSDHTYAHPKKAVEELVVNGYDAFANAVDVFTADSEFSKDYMVVWDDGLSMDADGLRRLWHIARSPKKGEVRVIKRGDETRQVIGKFGIGKLAAYTLGDELTYVCKRDGQILLVAVEFSKLKSALNESDDEVQAGRYETPIRKLTEAEARSFLEARFTTIPHMFDDQFSKSSWTVAISGSLRDTARQMSTSDLRIILSNAMPLRPDFEVRVDGEKVTPRVEKTPVEKSWSLDDDEMFKELMSQWSKENKVDNSPSRGKEAGLDPNDQEREVGYLELPRLGKIWGDVTLYQESLDKRRSREVGYSYGFFLLVHGRLVNGSDPVVFLPDPSFGAFYRSRYVVHADGLDDILLSSRERLKSNDAKSHELEVLQRALYLVTRRANDKAEDKAMEEMSAASRLPVGSRDYYLDPLVNLWRAQFPDVPLSFEPGSPEVHETNLGAGEPIAELQEDGFHINLDHPYHGLTNDMAGGGKRGSKIRREFGALGLMEPVFDGFLMGIGLPSETVSHIRRWRDAYLRRAAGKPSSTVGELIAALHEKSFKTADVFEDAIVDIMRAMGYVASRHGEAGKKDVLVIGADSDAPFRFVIEAKGKGKGKVNNDEAEVSHAGRHRDAEGADHAVIVARDFTGFAQVRADGVAIIGQCEACPGVSIMTTEALGRLLEVVDKHKYPIDHPEVIEVFTAVESPEDKLKRIDILDRPLETYDYRRLLEAIWTEQGGKQEGRDVSVTELFRHGDIDRTGLGDKKEELQVKLMSIQIMAFPLVQLDEARERVVLRQSPSHIADLIAQRLSIDADKDSQPTADEASSPSEAKNEGSSGG